MDSACPSCGARAPGPPARFCPACGSALPPPPPAEPAVDPAERLRALRDHPAFAALMERVPPDAARGPRVGAGLVAAAALLAVGLVVVLPLLLFPPLAIAGAVVVALGAYQLATGAMRGGPRDQGELVRVPARVVAEHLRMAGAGSDAGARHFVHLESEQGTREEYEVPAELAARLAPDDVGVAYFRGPRLVDFAALLE